MRDHFCDICGFVDGFCVCEPHTDPLAAARGRAVPLEALVDGDFDGGDKYVWTAEFETAADYGFDYDDGGMLAEEGRR